MNMQKRPIMLQQIPFPSGDNYKTVCGNICTFVTILTDIGKREKSLSLQPCAPLPLMAMIHFIPIPFKVKGTLWHFS